MSKITNQTACPICNSKLDLQESKNKILFYHCKKCNVGGKGKTAEEAKKDLIQASQKISTALSIPNNPKQIATWAEQNISVLIDSSAQFIDKLETRRMIQKNVNYMMKTDFKKAWNTDEGRMSIVEAFTEALYYGCILGEMGDIVPFGQVVEFIPGMATFEFALTTGKAAPLKDISMIVIFENDIINKLEWDENGDFVYNIKIGIPRGEEIRGVLVSAYDIERKKKIGDFYDEKRLMKKAEQHSKSYKYYLRDINALREAQSEGNDFILDKWNNKKYESDITNPYANADKPEMLKKVAGKSYFRPYMKIRNARAVVEENRQSANTKDVDDIYEKTLDDSLNAMKSNIVDAEIIPDSSESQEVKEEKQESAGEEKDLFNDAD